MHSLLPANQRGAAGKAESEGPENQRLKNSETKDKDNGQKEE